MSPSSSDFGVSAATRVDDDKADRARAHQRIGDLQRLFTRVGLRDQELVEVHAQFLGVLRIQRMFGVDEGADPALLLFLGHHVQRQRRLARAFRPVDLDDPALGQPADPQRDVEAERTRRRRLDIPHGVVAAELHDRALAELSFDLGQRAVESLLLVGGRAVGHFENIRHSHGVSPLMSCSRQCGNAVLLFASCSHAE
jgi:hypothetical protein